MTLRRAAIRIVVLFIVAFAGLRAGETFVIVHGAWGGGWAWKKIDRLLTADGHLVYRPTLTGLGERVHLASAEIDLTTHVTDVVNLILWEDMRDVVLVGHSYGGMVITGVLERVPDRIKRAVFVDALVPNDGESLVEALGDQQRLGEAVDGFIIPHWVKPGKPLPHDVPHPAKTLSEPVSFRNPAALSVPATFILTVDSGQKPEGDRFHKFSARARERGWAVVTMEADHNPQWRKPEELVPFLMEPGLPARN